MMQLLCFIFAQTYYLIYDFMSWTVFQGDENESASLFTGEEELFAFERVMSRLTEMQTENYWNERDNMKQQQKKRRDKVKVKS